VARRKSGGVEQYLQKGSAMNSHRVKYLRLIEAEARKHGILSNWVPFALKAAPFIADDRHAGEAAGVFLQWLIRNPVEELLETEEMPLCSVIPYDSSTLSVAA
jgi:hypothetical protein